MLNANQVVAAKQAIGQCTKGGVAKVDHVSTDTADFFRFPSDTPENSIKAIVDSLGKQFGCVIPVPLSHSKDKMPLGGDFWYETQFVK